MPKITFRGVKLRYIDIRRNEGGVFTRLHLTADYTTPVQERMEWEHIPDSISQCKLDGALDASTLIITPHDPALKQHERQIDISEVSDFAVHRVTVDESTRTELRFIARTPSAQAAGIIEDYWRTIGEADAQMIVRYSEQGELGEDGPAEETESLFEESTDEGPHTVASVSEMRRRKRDAAVQ